MNIIPECPTLASASPLQIAAGQQAQADISVTAVPVYKVTGIIAGHTLTGSGFQVFTPSGDEISLPTNFNMETGGFTLDDVPAGNYVPARLVAGRCAAAASGGPDQRLVQRRWTSCHSGARCFHSGGGASGFP